MSLDLNKSEFRKLLLEHHDCAYAVAGYELFLKLHEDAVNAYRVSKVLPSFEDKLNELRKLADKIKTSGSLEDISIAFAFCFIGNMEASVANMVDRLMMTKHNNN